MMIPLWFHAHIEPVVNYHIEHRMKEKYKRFAMSNDRMATATVLISFTRILCLLSTKFPFFSLHLIKCSMLTTIEFTDLYSCRQYMKSFSSCCSDKNLFVFHQFLMKTSIEHANELHLMDINESVRSYFNKSRADILPYNGQHAKYSENTCFSTFVTVE